MPHKSKLTFTTCQIFRGFSRKKAGYCAGTYSFWDLKESLRQSLQASQSELIEFGPGWSDPLDGTFNSANRSTTRSFKRCDSIISLTSAARTCAYQTP